MRTDANINRGVEYELKRDPDIGAFLGLAFLPQTARVTKQRKRAVLHRDPDIRLLSEKSRHSENRTAR